MKNRYIRVRFGVFISGTLKFTPRNVKNLPSPLRFLSGLRPGPIEGPKVAPIPYLNLRVNSLYTLVTLLMKEDLKTEAEKIESYAYIYWIFDVERKTYSGTCFIRHTLRGILSEYTVCRNKQCKINDIELKMKIKVGIPIETNGGCTCVTP